MNLFAHARREQIERESPLANRMRPRTLDDFAGQAHIVGPGRLLRRAIQADQLSSLIFYGPPGTGKTTLAAIIANHTQSHFITINAVLAGVKEIREAIADALERRQLYNQRTTLFVDEVHRWNKAQQDALLPHVENGTIILIGATTENPYFEVNKALVSRSRIFQLRPLTEADLRQIAHQALADPERGYGRLPVEVTDEALEHLVNVANGDARGVLNALELAVETTPPGPDGTIYVDLQVAEESIQRRAVLYDKDGDVHYDTISAFIKSVRGSDPDAALYWMARMLYAGEDPRFIFRRMAILAAEDIGLADPQATMVVNSCWELYEKVGLPEGRFHLSEAALYLATCPKSNSTLAFFDALASVEQEQEPDVPLHLKDNNRDAEGFGHGKGYLYPHAYRDHWVAQQYLPAALQGKLFYQPSDQGYERAVREAVARRREAQLAAMLESTAPGPAEVLTTGPVDRRRDAWLARAAGASQALAMVRDRLFDLAAVRRHELVLVVGESSGLLAWEAVRRAPEGGVWVLAEGDEAGELLRGQAEQLPALERPTVLVGAPADLERLLDLRGETDLRFDCLLGRNLFPYGPDPARLRALAAWLRPGGEDGGGRLCLAQVVPRRGQRLSALLDATALPANLLARIQGAEEALYADPDDPVTRWDAPDLVDACAAAGLEARLTLETTQAQRRVADTQLARWLSPDPGEDGRPSYLGRLAASGLTAEETARLSALLRARLAGQTVAWQTATAYVVAHPAG